MKPLPEDGGPAFPTISASVHMPHHGMTLRDWFAGMATNGLCSNSEWLDNVINRKSEGEAVGCVADASYRLADAMLAARAGKEDA